MAFIRFSATERFGIPIKDASEVSSAYDCVKLLERNNLEPTEITDPGPLDITPYYWKRPNFRHMLSKPLDDIVKIDFIPTTVTSEFVALLNTTSDLVVPVRTIEIPTDQDMFALAGGSSPRYPGSLCIFEVIAYLPE